LIGLNETQFRQVMVLPQGKFRELLLASSKEREAIFGQLFQTDMYKKIEFALKDKASAISKAKNDFDNQIRGALKVADSHSEEELDEHYQIANQVYAAAKQQESEQRTKLTAAEKEQQVAINIEKQFVQLAGARVALDTHLTLLPEYTSQQEKLALAQKASAITLGYQRWQTSEKYCLELKQQLNQLTTQVAETENELATQHKILEKSEQDAQSLPELTTRKFELEQSKAKWLEKVELECRIKGEQSEQRQLEEKLVQYQSHKQKLTSDANASEQALQKARPSCY
jgi:exonuclease SbcC